MVIAGNGDAIFKRLMTAIGRDDLGNDPELARNEELEIPVQVNGKLRSRVVVAPDITETELRALALADSKVQSFIDGHEVVKVIVVPQRLVNVVVKSKS